MGNWESLEIGRILPPELVQVASALTNITNLISQEAQVAQEAITAINTLTTSNQSPLDIVVNTLIQAAQDLVESLLQVGKVQMIYIPIPKKFAEQGRALLPADLQELVDRFNIDSSQLNNSILDTSAQNSYLQSVQSDLGNAGFYNRFILSLIDNFDINRPQYLKATDYVACVTFLAGSSSYVELIKTVMLFDRLFRTQRDDFASRSLPTPQNLRGKVIGAPASNRIGVRLEWDVQPKNFSPMYFPVTMGINRVAVIRSTNPKALSAMTITDLFETENLTEGLTSADDQTKVLRIMSGLNTSFVDDDSNLNSTDTYYYFITWEVLVSEGKTQGFVPWYKLSNGVKIRKKEPLPSHNSTPPDWYALPSVIDFFPEIATTLRIFIEELKTFSDKNKNINTGIKSALTMFTQTVTNYQSKVKLLNDQLNRVQNLLANTHAGIYTTSFAGEGGNALLVSELGKRLFDKTDSTRPPFDSDEFVVGAVLVIGGPRQIDVQPMLDVVNLLFGSNTNNPVVTALTSLNTLIDQQEQNLFGSSLTTIAMPLTDPITGLPTMTIDPHTGNTAITPHVVFSDPLGGIDTNDPGNPNSGETGKKTITC